MAKTEGKTPTTPQAPGHATVTHGSVTLTVPEHVKPPENAANLSAEEVKRIAKVPLGIGLACAQAADAGEKAGDKFTWPGGVTPSSLRSNGRRAEDVDGVIHDIEVILATVKKSNLIFDAIAWDQLRAVNDQVKAQSKRNPELLAIFSQLIDYLSKGPKASVGGGAPAPAPGATVTK